jgi:hypothetical protein
MILSSLRSVRGDLIQITDQSNGVVVRKADGTTTGYTAEEWAELSVALPAFNDAAKVGDTPLPASSV